MADPLFLGAGLAFPFEADPGGSLVLRSGPEKIAESIRLILATRRGERPMRPDFGCAAHELVFAPAASPRTLGAVSRAVEEALLRWEPRVDVTGVTAWPGDDDGTGLPVLYVEVEYVIKATNDPRNLVHPFYTIPPEAPARAAAAATAEMPAEATAQVLP